jgi:hypothetical protein
LNWLQQLTNWLLVIDNLDDVSVINGFLPLTDSNGHTLITTRNPNTAGIPEQGVEAGVLDVDAGIELFRLHSKLPPTLNFSEVRNIVHELGCLPLAIEQRCLYPRNKEKH